MKAPISLVVIIIAIFGLILQIMACPVFFIIVPLYLIYWGLKPAK